MPGNTPWIEIGLTLFTLLMNTIGFLIIYVLKSNIATSNAQYQALKQEVSTRFARIDECTNHLEAQLKSFEASFDNWKVLSTEVHGRVSAIGARVGDLIVDVKKMTELVPVLEYRINAIDREIHKLKGI